MAFVPKGEVRIEDAWGNAGWRRVSRRAVDRAVSTEVLQARRSRISPDTIADKTGSAVMTRYRR